MMENADDEQFVTFQSIIDAVRPIDEAAHIGAKPALAHADIGPFRQPIEGYDQSFQILSADPRTESRLAIGADVANVLSRGRRGA
ncbi:MAG: hypothetical protein PGN08_14705 [Sphingomonas taxi]